MVVPASGGPGPVSRGHPVAFAVALIANHEGAMAVHPEITGCNR
jgi:hypothetical protein